VLAAVAVCAMTRAALAHPPQPAKVATEETRHQAFLEITKDEASQRAKGAESFPVDAWSQDDAFHHSEWESVESVAKRDGVRFADVLRALDDGMREHWPTAPDVTIRDTVPPCRPRPIY
jgi:uncharacterized membrane protein YqiK